MIFITRLISYSDYNSFSGCDVVVSAQMAPINEGDAMKTHVLGSLQTISYSTHQDRAPVRSIGNINAIDYVQGQRTIAGTMVFAMFHEHWMTPLLEELASHVSNTDIWSDELPALNLTISMANEYGYKSNMVLYGVKFIDDGGVISINDLYTENTLQYVATGIQPLKTSGQYDHSYSKHNTYELGKIMSMREAIEHDKSWTAPEAYEKEWIKPKEVNVDNSNMTAVFHPFEFTVVIDPPLNARDIIFDGDENIQHSTYAVYITPEPDNNREPFINVFLKDADDSSGTAPNTTPMEKVPNEDIWYAEVPRGKYDLIVEADEDIHHYIWTLVVDADNVQNNVTITTDFTTETIPKTVAIHPVIVGAGETSVTTITNTFYDQLQASKLKTDIYNDYQEVETEDVKIYDIVSDASIGRSYNKEILIESLSPNSKYSIKSIDSQTGESSESVIVQTLSQDSSLQDKLNIFIQTNADILANKDLSALDCETKYEYSNLLDAVVNISDFAAEPELTLYACVLQNKFNNTYNDSGIGIAHKNYIDNLLLNQYNIDESSEYYTLFKKNQTKNYHVLKAEAKEVVTYTGQSNVHYYIQPIAQNNIKSTRVDFVTFTDEDRNELQQYINTKHFADLSLLDNSYRYNTYNTELINAIKAVDNFTVYRNLLDAPNGYMMNNTLFVNTDYNDKDIKDDLYLCIAEPYESINNFPIIKLPIDDSNMAISRFDALLISDAYYLMWIQDSNFNNISLPSVFSTYEEDYDLADYQAHLIETELDSMSEMFPSNSIYRSYFNTALDVVLAEQNMMLKDIRYVALQALLLLYEDNLLARTIDDVMSMVVSICFDNYNMKAKFVKRDSIISYDTEYDKTVISCINISSNGVFKSHCQEYDINSCYDGYTILFLTNDKYNLKSNTLLINNNTKQIFVSNIELEVSK